MRRACHFVLANRANEETTASRCCFLPEIGETVTSRWQVHDSAWGEAKNEAASVAATNEVKMTLCGSEVPQDRWRGRTAGSGMWTRTENLLSWSPSGDSAIPYG